MQLQASNKKTLTIVEVSLYGRSPVLQVSSQLLHYTQLTMYFLNGPIPASFCFFQ